MTSTGSFADPTSPPAYGDSSVGVWFTRTSYILTVDPWPKVRE